MVNYLKDCEIDTVQKLHTAIDEGSLNTKLTDAGHKALHSSTLALQSTFPPAHSYTTSLRFEITPERPITQPWPGGKAVSSRNTDENVSPRMMLRSTSISAGPAQMVLPSPA